MKLKMKLFIVSLLFLVLCSVAMVSANENVTDDISLDNSEELELGKYNNEILSVEETYDELAATAQTKPIKAKISAKSYSSSYDSAKKLKVQVKDSKGNPVKNVLVKFKFSNGVDYDRTNSKGTCGVYVPDKVGTHKATISLDDKSYTAKAIKVKVKISKAPVKISTKKIKTDNKSKFKLKAVVRDRYGYLIDSGSVKFKINGKTYKAKVNNGVAVKKLRLKYAKTYSYKATFLSKNYKTKAASSKVVVKKVYVIKKAGYKFKISESKYKRIQYVKNHRHASHLSKYANFYVKTKYTYYGLPVYAIVTTWSGIQGGQYLNYPQVQFVSVYDGYIEDYITAHYKI